MFGIFFNFKKITYSIGLYNLYLFVFGTNEFKAEVKSLNKLYNLNLLNINKINFNFLTNIFYKKVPYTFDIDLNLYKLAQVTKRKSIFIIVQETTLASYFTNRVNMFSIGFFSYSTLKHTHSFLVPIFIESFFMKLAMYSYIFSYIQHGYNLKLFIFFKYYINIKIFFLLKTFLKLK